MNEIHLLKMLLLTFILNTVSKYEGKFLAYTKRADAGLQSLHELD